MLCSESAAVPLPNCLLAFNLKCCDDKSRVEEAREAKGAVFAIMSLYEEGGRGLLHGVTSFQTAKAD